MTESAADLLEFYRRYGIVTDPGDCAGLFTDLPTGVAALRDVVQGLMVHIFWAKSYNLNLSEERQGEVQIRGVARKLARALELDSRPLTEARPYETKLVGNCRDFSVMLASMLQYQGVPARARCGFGRYFTPNHYEDHWVCEYWNADEGRWVLVDAQLDALMRDALKLPFDPLDTPRDQFIVGGKAWQLCRSGEADPETFGIFDMSGLGFVQGDLLRDFLALNKVEILPWDDWGLMPTELKAVPEENFPLMDRIAELTLGGDEAFPALRALYESDPRLRVPPESWQV